MKKAARTGRVGTRKIEGAEQVREILAVNETIDGAPRGIRVGNVHRVAAGLEVELAGNHEQRVAQCFKIRAVAGSCANTIDCPDQFWRKLDCPRCFGVMSPTS